MPRKILKKAIKSAINVHPSLLPRWRGPDPIRNAIINDDKHIGVSLHIMTDQFDRGQVISQSYVENNENLNVSDYIRILGTLGGSLLVANLKNKSIPCSEVEVYEDTTGIEDYMYAHDTKKKLMDIKNNSPSLYMRLIS